MSANKMASHKASDLLRKSHVCVLERYRLARAGEQSTGNTTANGATLALAQA